MPKKKTIPTEEPAQDTAELLEQAGASTDGPPPEVEKAGDLPPGPPGEGLGLPAEGDTAEPERDIPEVLDVDADAPPMGGGPADVPVGPQEPGPDGGGPQEAVPPADAPADARLEGQAPAEDAPSVPEPAAPAGEGAPARPMTDRQSFFALDFHELDRGLSPEERQAWSSIYASYRGHSALSGSIVGVDVHSMNVRSRATGQVERRTMYCAMALVYRVPVYIPATEMWSGEARPDYVLQNMMGAAIDFIITKVDREGGYAIASRRQASRAQRHFFTSRPDLCRKGARVKCRMLSVGPRRCLAECYGYDVGLTQRELSYTAIADLREKYHPGDELDCIVKGYDTEKRELQISVKETEPNPYEGAELRHPVGSRRFAVVAGKYGGGVFCDLPDGTVCLCNYSYQHEDSEFQSGDHVMLVVKRFEPNKQQMYGKILSKW